MDTKYIVKTIIRHLSFQNNPDFACGWRTCGLIWRVAICKLNVLSVQSRKMNESFSSSHLLTFAKAKRPSHLNHDELITLLNEFHASSFLILSASRAHDWTTSWVLPFSGKGTIAQLARGVNSREHAEEHLVWHQHEAALRGEPTGRALGSDIFQSLCPSPSN